MSPRNSESLVHDLLRLPWWGNLILAALVYVGLRYGLPLLTIGSVVLDGFAAACMDSGEYLGDDRLRIVHAIMGTRRAFEEPTQP